MDKRKLREVMRKKRASIGAENRSQWSAAICRHVLEFLSHARSGGRTSWAGYRAFGSEVSLDPVYEQTPQLVWHFPRVDPEGSSPMQFCAVTDLDIDFEKHPLGMLQPKPETAATEVNSLHGVFYPLLAFDRQGNRLGYGKGHYDRATCQFKGARVGIAFSLQQHADTIAAEAHDERLHAVITENGILRFDH